MIIKRIDIDAAEVIRLFEVEKLSGEYIAHLFGVSHATVLSRLKEAGIVTTRKCKRRDLNDDEIIHLYCNEGLSADKIADRFNASHSTIFRILRHRGIRIRKPGGARNSLDLDLQQIKDMYVSGLDGTDIAERLGISFPVVYRALHKARVVVKERPRKVPLQDIVHLYVNEELSQPQIAARLGISPSTVHYRLVRSGIELRAKSETCSGARNPSWRGGTSFGRYCPEFNDDLKESIREAFVRRCFLCSAIEKGQKLSVHHCDYNKGQGCGMRWTLIPLCRRCHGKTNFQRHYYFNLLGNYWAQKYLEFR